MPTDGLGEFISIFINSSLILSIEIFSAIDMLFLIASSVTGSILKPNCDAILQALKDLKPSSLNLSIGVPTALTIFFLISPTPSKGS